MFIFLMNFFLAFPCFYVTRKQLKLYAFTKIYPRQINENIESVQISSRKIQIRMVFEN